jgi:hypothetical protein
MDLYSAFQSTYANLPLSARKEIIVIIDSEPLTWNSAKVEVDNSTAKGSEILEKLYSMKLLNE